MLKLKPKKIEIKSGNTWIAVLHEDTAHKLDLHPGDRVELSIGKGKARREVNAILDISEDYLKRDQIGLFTETWKKLEVKRGDTITVNRTSKPTSVIYIREKLLGGKLSARKIDEIIRDVVAEDLSSVEMAYFVSGAMIHGLSDLETVNLTKSIVKHGSKLNFGKGKIVLDKHCIGGVPGNRTTMIIIPICTSLGLTMPKTSSRAITSPAGTADTMETLCEVAIEADDLMRIAKKTGGFIAWGGGVDLAAADDKMIKVRHPLSLDPQGMLLASIMAKKFSAGSNHVLIDIPVGDQVKIKTKKDGMQLKKRFENIGRMLGMKVKVIMTEGEEPIGQGIGPALEAVDVLATLRGDSGGSKDLREKAVYMAGILLEMCGKSKKGQGAKLAAKQLDSGAAYDQMLKIIKAQGQKTLNPKVGRLKKDFKAEKSGVVSHVNNKMVARVARIAGAPKSPGSGLWLEKKLGDKVKKGDVLFTIYSDSAETLKTALKFALKDKPYTIK
ncbi:thymidine phosphorylase family protein [Candidatus Peregrinibacteria bacterium]|jgi:putative thymidine phosphorylase|nr:thymidine phosphorylase family protein [Candidatus Peregrinibacteria bacterium]MBT7483294.1 thymidine phosphorylase family protein [Candidatus Peregrinibacteria bacterium]MBT7702619.1 thymidine phosphorylase family protein [Candidatus Peregrinibacteria bacterium]